jgi:hypothetical protein
MLKNNFFHAYGAFYALGTKFEVRVEYGQDLDGDISLEGADLIGIFLDSDKKPTTLNHDIQMDLDELSDWQLETLREIAETDAEVNGPWDEGR